MPSSILPSIPNLKRLTTFIEAQDGSKKKNELLPQMGGKLAVGQASPPTSKAVSAIISKVQSDVKHFREKQRNKEHAEEQYAAFQQRMDSTRMTQARRTQMEKMNNAIIHAFKNTKAPVRTAVISAEEKLSDALAALRERNAQHTAEREQQERLAVEERKAKRTEEKKQREESIAAEKAEKRAAEAKQRDEENELKTKIRDQRALQSLEAKARVMNLEIEQKQKAQRDDRISGMLEILLKRQVEGEPDRRRAKRPREDNILESDDDQENIDPRDGWRV